MAPEKIEEVTTRLRALLTENFSHLPGIGNVSEQGDLRDHGILSLDIVGLLLAIEIAFSIEVPEELITPDNFRTLNSISSTILQISP